MRVWVDLTNSPHALFFAPIVRALQSRGDQVLVTARRFAHTVELSRRLLRDVTPVGSGQPRALAGKVAALGGRVAELLPLVRRFDPDVAAAHGSYDQPITARLLRIPALAMVDYEYHPGTHLLFRLANRLLLPEAFPKALVDAHGGRGKTWRYRGLKEEVYLAGFRPDPAVRSELVGAAYDGRVVTVRPPALGAMYHRRNNPLWAELIAHLRDQPQTLTLILPRHPAHVAALTESFAAATVRVVDHPVDGPSLIWHSDAVISAGGTMNREAVALGRPVWSLFSGRLGAVDRALIAAGRMHRLATAADVRGLTIPRAPRHELPVFGDEVLQRVIAAIDATARLKRRAPVRQA